MLGHGLNAATTGNVFQAELKYGANTELKNDTGKDVLTHSKIRFIKKMRRKNCIFN